MNNPKYIYVNDLIPTPLKTAELDPEELKIVSFLSYKTNYAVTEHDGNLTFPIAKVFAQPLFGSLYYEPLGRLLSEGIIEKEGIGTNQNGEECYYAPGRCTYYKLRKDCIKAIRGKDYSKKELKIPFVHSPKTPAATVQAISKSDSELVIKLAKAYEGLNVTASWQGTFSPDNPDAFYGGFLAAKNFVKQIHHGKVNVSIGECGRIFHPLICMQREIRSFVTKDGGGLVGIDGKAFHPHLLAHFLGDSSRSNYVDFLGRNDIYSVFVDDAHDRDEIKRLFQIFLGSKIVYGKAQEIEWWYLQNYPEIIQWMRSVRAKGGTVQMELQRLESSIFVDDGFANADFWSVPMHDGLGVVPRDADMAVTYCSDIIRKRLGYDIRVEKKAA